MRDDNFYTISGWMVNRLCLKDNDIKVYALIYGFSQDGKTKFEGSLNYIAESVGVTQRGVVKILNRLCESGLIIKQIGDAKLQEPNKYFCDLSKTKASEQSSDTPLNSETKASELSSDNIYIYNNIYSKANFLKNWNQLRTSFLKTESNLNKLHPEELADFNQLVEMYSKEDFHTALKGLFQQESMPKAIMRFRPKHFLKNIDQYLDAEKNKNYKLYV